MKIRGLCQRSEKRPHWQNFFKSLKKQWVKKARNMVGETNQEKHMFWKEGRISLMVHWLGIHLSVRGTWIRSLVQEDPTCCGATKPVSHKYWAHSLASAGCNYWNVHALEPVPCNKRRHRNEKPVYDKREWPCSLQPEKARAQQWRTSAANNKCNN